MEETPVVVDGEAIVDEQPTQSVAEEKTPKAAKPKRPKIKFTYTIKNNGSVITKSFKGEASPEDVVLTLFSSLIGDIKTNIDPTQYEQMRDFLFHQYNLSLLTPQEADATQTITQ